MHEKKKDGKKKKRTVITKDRARPVAGRIRKTRDRGLPPGGECRGRPWPWTRAWRWEFGGISMAFGRFEGEERRQRKKATTVEVKWKRKKLINSKPAISSQ